MLFRGIFRLHVRVNWDHFSALLDEISPLVWLACFAGFLEHLFYKAAQRLVRICLQRYFGAGNYDFQADVLVFVLAHIFLIVEFAFKPSVNALGVRHLADA